MIIKRDAYLNRLIEAKHDGFIKIVTGLRRCGKSYLLFHLFKRHLLDHDVTPAHIIEIDLERKDMEKLRSPTPLRDYIQSRLVKDGKWNYVFIDEIQLCRRVLDPAVDLSRIHPDDRDGCYETFYSVLSQLRSMPRVDVYVTGSNSKMLATDIATEFRGRGEVIPLFPLSMAEFLPLRKSARDLYSVFYEYLDFGGLPECVMLKTPERKTAYLADLYKTIYIRDIAERNGLKSDELLDALTHVAMSNVGSLTNPAKLANAIQTAMGIRTNRVTVAKYLRFLTDAYILQEATRFDIKGNHYLDTPLKYYAGDCGLRNAALGFRQNERSHLMENAIYNELKRRGYAIDVGVVDHKVIGADGKATINHHEIDFVINKASERIYIQSAFAIPDPEKRNQETFSLRKLRDGFRRVVVTGDPYEKPWLDEHGITFIGIMPFLLDPKSIETL